MSAWTLWETANEPDLEVTRLPWPAMSALTRVARPLHDLQDNPAVDRALSTVWSARRLLTSTPLPADHTCAGLIALTADLEQFAIEHPSHSATPALIELNRATTALLADTSPISEWVADVLCEYGERGDGRPSAVLVVPRATWLDPVRDWLDSEGLNCVDLATPAQLRSSCEHEVAIVLGHPATTYAASFRPPEAAMREHGWLLTAPPAPRVRLALPVGAQALTGDQLWVWPQADAHPDLRLHDGTPADAPGPPPGLAQAEQMEWFTPPAATTRPSHPATQVDSADAASALGVVTASGHTLYFDPSGGPFPQVVTLEETGEVTVTAATVAKLVRGRILAVHMDGPQHIQLERRADAWLARSRDWPPERIQAARAGAKALKLALIWGLHIHGSEGITSMLTARGLSPNYALGLTHRALDLTYIAPHPRGFDALLDVLAAVPDSPQDFVAQVRAVSDDLPTLRAAHQQAGDLIHTDLRAQLAARTWEDAVQSFGWDLVDHDTLGALLLTTVVSVATEPVPVPRTWLAQALDATGRRATSATIVKERR